MKARLSVSYPVRYCGKFPREYPHEKILFLQNEPSRYSPSRVDLRFQAAGFDVDIYWCAQGEFPEQISAYSGAFIYASPHGAYEPLDWIMREHDLIQELARQSIPCLGICFGSQILGSALCGRDQLFTRQKGEAAYQWIELHLQYSADPLLNGLCERVEMFVWHNDELRADHPDMRILGSTPTCPNHIWRFRDLPIWGVQV